MVRTGGTERARFRIGIAVTALAGHWVFVRVQNRTDRVGVDLQMPDQLPHGAKLGDPVIHPVTADLFKIL